MHLPIQWSAKSSVNNQEIDTLQQELELHALTAHLLVARGYSSPEKAQRFLYPTLRDLPSPNTMKGMDKACARIIEAMEKNQKIVVYGDYDVDGITSTSLLQLFFRELGLPPQQYDFVIPHRLKDGYGLQASCLPKVIEMGCELLITVDCGIGSIKEVSDLNAEGIDVIVIDHHIPSAELPPARAILNPLQKGCEYPDKNLAAVGVTYQLLIGLRAALRNEGFFSTRKEPNLLKYIDIVALGTIADVVPLQGVNRILVHQGLQQMRRTQWPGLQSLMEVSGVPEDEPIRSDQIGFRLGPRLNAAGRLNHASQGVALICSEDPVEALQIANKLNETNVARKDLQEKIYEHAQDMLDEHPELLHDSAIVLADESWHLGVIGIVASRLLEEYHRPVILLAIDEKTGIAKGSARSIEGFSIHQGLIHCQTHLLAFGGHAAAAGLKLHRQHIDEFRQQFYAYASDHIAPDVLSPTLLFDAEFDPFQLSMPLIDELQLLEPHGRENPAPVLTAHQIPILSQRKTRDGRHLQVTFSGQRQSLKAIAFSQASHFPLPSEVSIAYQPQINTWNGRRKIQLYIENIETKDS